MKVKSSIIAAIVFAMTATSVFAQNGVNSPYSRYGFGMQTDRSMGFNKGMSGVAQGFRNGNIINPANPASYSAVDSLTALFDFGISLQNGNFKMDNLQQNARNASLDYAAFHFRTTKGVGIALGILPYTNINYKFNSDSEKLSGNEDITSSYAFAGDGGLHQAFLGVGVELCKPLSLGVNGSFLFGDYSHTMTMAFSDGSAYSLIRGYSADISTWMVDFGLQYTQKINKKDKFVVGLSYGLGHEVTNRAKRYTETFNTATSTVEGITGDTIKNAFQLPHTFSAGIAYYKANKLTIGADFELQKWSECKFPSQNSDGTGLYEASKGQLNDKFRISAGGEYLPNIYPNAMARSLGQKLGIKFGAFFERPYANADNTGTLSDKPYEFGLSAGVRFPIANKNLWRSKPQIQFSVQWIHSNIPYLANNVATPTVSHLTENYLKFSIGLTFNEHWFYKMKME